LQHRAAQRARSVSHGQSLDGALLANVGGSGRERNRRTAHATAAMRRKSVSMRIGMRPFTAPAHGRLSITALSRANNRQRRLGEKTLLASTE
jgi:hypothetical protein